MEKFNRAERRNQVERLKKKRSNYWGYKIWRQEEMPSRQLGKVVQYPQACSCPMCGNNRRIYGPTLKEKSCLEILKLLS